jgi:hypothetical protein
MLGVLTLCNTLVGLQNLQYFIDVKSANGTGTLIVMGGERCPYVWSRLCLFIGVGDDLLTSGGVRAFMTLEVNLHL